MNKKLLTSMMALSLTLGTTSIVYAQDYQVKAGDTLTIPE